MRRVRLTTRLFFATDLHGSEKCYYKFVNAAKFYKVNILVMGGDITGKLLIPVVEEGGGKYHATFSGSRRTAKNEEELQQLQKDIRFSGYYPYVTDPDQMKQLQTDETKVHTVFVQVMLDTFRSWIHLAEERLKGTDVKVYITGGNDDLPGIKDVLHESDFVIDPEDQVVSVDGKHEMISCGWSNPTPWKTPRECSEEELWAKIENMAMKVKDMRNCIFNLHVPPIDSGLDTCPRLDENLKPVIKGGEIEMTTGGSTSVRKALETYQPLVGLHGHIHESKGFIKLGQTLALNPGSEYSEGILRGVLVELDDGALKSYMLTQG